MVGRITSLSKSGLKDWFLQRVSAVVILVYVVFFILFIISGKTNYSDWINLFSSNWFKIFTVLAVFSILVHAWVGIWTILTDYVKCAWIMGILQTLIVIGYFLCLVWTIDILWDSPALVAVKSTLL